MKAVFKVNEAFALSEANGKKVKKIDIAKLLWPGRKMESLQVNMTNLTNGTTKRIAPEWVGILCRELNTTPNYLFGISEKKNSKIFTN